MTAGVLKPAEKYVHFNVPGAFSFVLDSSFYWKCEHRACELAKIYNVPPVWKGPHTLIGRMLSIFNSVSLKLFL